MTLRQKIFLVVVVLVAVVVAAGGVFLLTFDVNRYRGVILGQLSRSLNRPVEAADLELRLLPLRLRLNQVRIPESAGFAGKEFIQAQAVQVDLSLWSLLRGQPEVSALELDQPTVYLRQNRGGRWNVATLAERPSAAREPPRAKSTPPGEAGPVRNWLLREGTIVIERAGQPPLRLTGVEVAANDISATESFPFRLAVGFSPESGVRAAGQLGPLDFKAPLWTPLEAEVALESFRPATLGSLVAVPATVARLGPLAGKLQVKSGREGVSLTGKLDLLGSRSAEKVVVQLTGALPPDFSRVEWRDVAIESGPARITASGHAALAPPGPFDLSLRTSEADLGALLRIPPRLGVVLPFGGLPVTGKLTANLRVNGTPAAWRVNGTANLRNVSLTTSVLPEPVRIAAVDVTLNSTRLSTQPFIAQVGEKLRAQVTARLDNYQTRPALQARIETEGAELGALLGLVRSLGTDPLPGGRASGRVTAVIDLSGPLGEKAPPLDSSGQVQLVGGSVQPAGLAEPLGIERVEVEFRPDRLRVTSLRAAVAGAKLQGSLQVENFDAPRVSFDLRGDTLEVEKLQALFGAQPDQRASKLFLSVVHARERSSRWFDRLSGQGRLAFDRVRHGRLTLAPFAAPAVVGNQVVTCDPIEFGLYDGGGRGRLVVDLRGPKPVTEFNGVLRNVDANKLLSENSEAKNRLYGHLGGTLAVRFVGSERSQILRSAKGQGELTLLNGRLAQVNLNRELVTVGELMGLSYEQRDTPVEDMSTQFEIAEGWLRAANLILRTPDLTMEAVGGFSLEDELAFEATATFTPEASQRLRSRGPLGALTGSLFTDDQGRVLIPFLIRGTFAQPKFSLDAARLAEMKLRRGQSKPGGSLRDLLDRLRKRKEPPQ